MSGATPQESTTERSNYENESSDTSKEQSECTTTKIGQIKTVTEKRTHSTVTITTTKTPGRTETKTESKVTETITITEEGGQTPEITNTTNEEERPELSDHDVNEEESSGQSGVKSKTEPATAPAPHPDVQGGDTRLPDSLEKKGTSVEDITNGMSEVKLQESTSECSDYENESPKLVTAASAEPCFDDHSDKNDDYSDYSENNYNDWDGYFSQDKEGRSDYSDSVDYGKSDFVHDSEDDRGDESDSEDDRGRSDTSSADESDSKDDRGRSDISSADESSEEETSDHSNTLPWPKQSLHFTPSSTENSNMKGKEFEKYFEKRVRVAQANITSKVMFQKKVATPPEDDRKFCRPDAIFIHVNGKKAAIVELKNYEKLRLKKRAVNKTIKDMNAVKAAMKCSEVVGYMYIRLQTKVSQTVEDYAKENRITIMREGDIDADELAELIDSELNT